MTPRSEHFRFEQVAPGAWAAIAIDSGAGVGNAGVADLGGRSLVVDCGFTPAAGREVRSAAERLAGSVDRLVVTHAHFDHYGGARAFSDLPILATEATTARIREEGPRRVTELREGAASYAAELDERDAPAWEREQWRRVAAELPSLAVTCPTETLDGELDLGPARVIECGAGHTHSDTVVWLETERVLFAADLISVESHLNLAHGDPENWLRILDRLAELDPVRVVPGHGPPAGPEWIATARAYIETLLALAAEPGEHALPARYAGWAFPEGFQQNIDALRHTS
jgi:glyoxylase-like metal-dependent hydrolase (beta-lactamase superfamily II)